MSISNLTTQLFRYQLRQVCFISFYKLFPIVRQGNFFVIYVPSYWILLHTPFQTPEIVKCSPERDYGRLYSTRAEADARILLLAKDALLHGFEHAAVVCRDTNVLVLLHFKHQLPRTIWFKSGIMRNPKYVPVHEIKLHAMTWFPCCNWLR